MTTAAEDVLRRLWFPVDYDPARPRGIPATDAEVAAALQRRDDVIAYLRDAGWPEPLGLLSGNGNWTLFRVDLPNTEEVSRLFQQALGALSARFSDKIVTIDRAVYQPAQLFERSHLRVPASKVRPQCEHASLLLLVVVQVSARGMEIEACLAAPQHYLPPARRGPRHATMLPLALTVR